MHVRGLKLTAFAGIISVLFFTACAVAQDPPGRFEAGANLTAMHNVFAPADVGPGIDGDINFGRHIALDGSFSWLPHRPAQTFSGFFGAKIGTRSEHFGFFGKVRPGFITFTNMFRGFTFNQDTFQGTSRLARLTQKGLDLGTVVEYYPASHWTMRWDLGDTLMFQEGRVPNTTIIGGVATTQIIGSNQTTNHFAFSTAIHYRF